MRAEEYLQILSEQIRCKKARDAVKEEVRCHLKDQGEAFEEEGMEKEAAEEAAVKEMGDPVETGALLDRIHRPRMAWGMISLIVLLSIVGCLIQYFLTGRLWEGEAGGTVMSWRQLIFMVAGWGLMAGACYLDYSRIGMRAKEITVILFVLLYAGREFFGLQMNGASAWIRLPVAGMSLDIRLLMVLFVPLYGAVLYQMRGQGYKALFKAFLWMLPGILLSLSCSSLVTAWILFLSFTIVLSVCIYKNWFQVSRKKTLGILCGLLILLPVAGGLLTFFTGPQYQRERMAAILGLGETGYQEQAVKGLLMGSRLWGESAKVSAFTGVADRNDYMLTYITACYGILAAVVLTGLILFLFLRFLKISLGQKNQLGMAMGAGCAAVFIIQLLTYLLINVGLFPAASVYLPFISYGGSGALAVYLLLGILLSIYRYQNVLPACPAGSREKKVKE